MSRQPVETFEHGDHTIEVWHDDSPMNPWEDWDGEPPILVITGRTSFSYGIEDRVPYFDVHTRWKEAMELMDRPATFAGLRQVLRDAWNSYTVSDAIVEALNEYAEYLNPADRLDLYAEVYGWMNIPALSGYTTGYCQGDYAYVLVVATPEWAEETGAYITQADDLKHSLKLVGYWLWGDVYGYKVKDKQGEEVGSCWGFYGYDHEESGLLESARGEI